MTRAAPSALATAVLLLLAGLSAAGCEFSTSATLGRVTSSGETCPEASVACGDSCVRTGSDPNHCGGCDQRCGDAELCDLGACRPAAEGCSGGLLACSRACVDGQSNGEHCGGCDQRCAPEAECTAGSCVCQGEQSACGELCVDLQSDEAHCGGCDTACVDSQTCESGSCECPPGSEPCGDACANLQTSTANCGQCGVECATGQVCDGGDCACPDQGVLCAEGCVDTLSDASNCGQCGNACSGGQVCDGGECACPTGQAFCDEVCIDVLSDDANCGGCDVSCGLGEGCNQGDCLSGAFGEDGCGGLAADLLIQEVAAYQTIKVPVARAGELVTDRGSEVVAGRPTLVRVFVEPQAGFEPRELSARLHLENGEVVDTQYSESTLSIDQASSEDDRDGAFEFLVPAERITADTRFAVEVVECSGVGAAGDLLPIGSLPTDDQTSTPQPQSDGVTVDAVAPGASQDVPGARFPDSDGAFLDAVEAGSLRIHVVPVRSNGLLPDTSEQGLDVYRRAFLATFPIASLELTVGEPVDIADPEDWNVTLDTVRALRQQQNPDPEVYYYGMVRPTERFQDFCRGGCVAGVGFVPNGGRAAQRAAARVAVGVAYSDNTSAFTMLHEVGHNHGRGHSPCVPRGGQITGVDGNYPHEGGAVGVVGYSSATDDLLPTTNTDLMGYCGNQWLSDYTYNGLLTTVLSLNQAQTSEVISPERLGSWRVLLWDADRGSRWGIALDGAASGTLESAVVLDAAGQAIGSVSAYRTEVADLGYSIQVPQPQPGWHAIEVAGAAPLTY